MESKGNKNKSENIADRVKILEKELQDIKEKQRTCKHQYADPVRASRDVIESTYVGLESHGSDPEPIYTHRTKQEWGWERICNECGFTEYTTKTKPVIKEHVPDFAYKEI